MINIRLGDSFHMLFVNYIQEGDMCYFSVDFDESLILKHEQGQIEGRGAESYDISFTRSLDAGETRFGGESGIVALFIYGNFADSFLVTGKPPFV